MSGMKFSRRTYAGLGEFIGDAVYMVKNRRKIQDVNRGILISPAFRERIMLAVTAVNKCRYCTYVHTGEAIKSGLSREDVSKLLAGDVKSCPPEEAVALAYAQHWAETNANPDPVTRRKTLETYGQEKFEAIQTVLRLIRNGNLSGNSLDLMLYTLSFGRLGR